MSCVVLCMCKLPDIFNAFPIDIVVISAVLQTQLIDLRTANYQLKEEKTRKDAGKNLLLLLLYSQILLVTLLIFLLLFSILPMLLILRLL